MGPDTLEKQGRKSRRENLPKKSLRNLRGNFLKFAIFGRLSQADGADEMFASTSIPARRQQSTKASIDIYCPDDVELTSLRCCSVECAGQMLWSVNTDHTYHFLPNNEQKEV